MWNKKRDDDYAPRPPAPAAPPVETRSEPQTAGAPVKPPAPEPPRGVAAIGKAVFIKGAILSREDLYLDGKVEGTIEVPEHRLTIGPHAEVQAGTMKAREVIVLGTVNGDVEAAEKLDIRKDARLVGNIKTGGIIIEDGAYFKGSIDIVRGAPAAEPRPAVKVREPQPAPVQPVAPSQPALVGDQKR